MRRIALVGGSGYGLQYRRRLHVMRRDGLAELVAITNRSPLADDGDAPLDGLTMYTDHREMLHRERPDAVILATPPHTHFAIARDVLTAGHDLLLEKPPVTDLAEHALLAEVAHKHDVVCQVGFQALGSPALDRLAHTPELGDIKAVRAYGAWWRPDSYYARTAWAGRRVVDGRSAMDGAVANQFSHTLMQSIALINVQDPADRPVGMEAERYVSRNIEVEDTACVRVVFGSGREILLAVTLSAGNEVRGHMLVHGAAGNVDYRYVTDEVRLPGDAEWRRMQGRVDLLQNLLRHRADRQVPLVAPLARTRSLTLVLQHLNALPPPAPIPADHLAPAGDGSGPVIDRIDAIVREAAEQGALFSELGVPWAVTPARVSFGG